MVYPFWGVTGHFPAWFPSNEFYLVSAAGLWSSSRSAFVRRSYPSASRRMFLDSGGFSFFSRSGDYPFSIEQHLELVEHPYYGYNPLLWASRDYPCEPFIHRGRHNLISNQDRIEATLDNLEWLSSRSSHPGLVPVIQGYTLPERLYCCEQIFKRGLNRRLMAIGSLCALPSVRAISEIVSALSLYFPGQLWHLFGVKTSYFSSYRVPSSVFSFDTAAWGLGDKKLRCHSLEQSRFFSYRDKLLSILRPAPASLFNFS